MQREHGYFRIGIRTTEIALQLFGAREWWWELKFFLSFRIDFYNQLVFRRV